MAGFLDWLFGGGAQAQTIPPVPQGAVPQPVPATVPRTGNPLLGGDRNIQIQAALAGLGQFGQNLAEQYRRRPAGSPAGPMGNVSDAVNRSMVAAYQRRQQDREEESDRRWSELQAQNPALAGLPREVGQQVLARTLTREPPDPRRNFITTRTGIYRIGADGNLQPVQGAGMGGGGGAGAGGAAAGGAPFGASEESRAWGVLLNPAADPSSPLYHAAYSIISRPRLQPVPDPNNPMGTMLAEVRPEIPANIRRPADAAAAAPPTLRLGAPAQGPTGYVGGDVMGGGLPEPTIAPPALAQAPQQSSTPSPAPAPSQQPPQGRVTPLPGTERPAPEPSGEQRIVAGYASRMEAAERILGRLTESGYAAGNLRDNLAARSPLLGNYAMSNQGQQYRQAQEDWVRAKLRRESGAVIADEEMEREIRVYFPQPGDSAETIAQKARARRIAQQAMIQGAGRAYQRPELPSVERIQMMPITEIQGVVDRWDDLSQAQRAALRRRLGLEPQ